MKDSRGRQWKSIIFCPCGEEKLQEFKIMSSPNNDCEMYNWKTYCLIENFELFGLLTFHLLTMKMKMLIKVRC